MNPIQSTDNLVKFIQNKLEQFLVTTSLIKGWNYNRLIENIGRKIKISFIIESDINLKYINPELCHAKVRYDGTDKQCSRKKKKDSLFCGLHLNKNLKNGIIPDQKKKIESENEQNLIEVMLDYSDNFEPTQNSHQNITTMSDDCEIWIPIMGSDNQMYYFRKDTNGIYIKNGKEFIYVGQIINGKFIL